MLGLAALSVVIHSPRFSEWAARYAEWPGGLVMPLAWPLAVLVALPLADRITGQRYHYAIWTGFGRWGLLVTLAWLALVLDKATVFLQANWRKAILGVVSTAITFVALEIGARLWLDRLATPEQKAIYGTIARDADTVLYSPHHYLNYVTTPNYDDGVNRHNSLGFRGPEVAMPKPPGVFRIVAIGESTTYSIKVHDWREAYPAVLERILREDYGYSSVEVVNAGVGGYDTHESLINLEFRVLDLRPDLLLIYHGHNDIHTRLVDPKVYRGDNIGRRRQWDLTGAGVWQLRLPSVLLRYLAINLGLVKPLTLDEIVSRQDCCVVRNPDEPYSDLGGLTPREALQANPPIYFERNLRNMVAIARTGGSNVLLMTFAVNPNEWGIGATEYYQEATREHNDVIVRLSRELNVPVFDFASAMPLDPAYWVGSIHYSAEGEVVHARLIANYLIEAGLLPPLS